MTVLVGMFGLVLSVGLWASRRNSSIADRDARELILASRSLPLWVALLTMTATWVGGGYINGTAESTFTSGALWGIQPGLGFAFSLTLGGLLFARPMRRRNYVTLLDPLEQRYGRHLAAGLMIPAVLAEIIWSGAVLVALGTTAATILNVDIPTAIILSAGIAICYTCSGGFRAVAYTDTVQLLLIVIGLGVTLPFVISMAGGLSSVLEGAFPPFRHQREIISYTDLTIVLVLGGIPWNVYFQRVLASKNEQVAAQLSLAAAPLCVILAIPPLLAGLAATNLDWRELAGPEETQLLFENGALALPYVIKYTTPPWVSWLALGAIAAAVMSSVDSSILSAASLITWNGYRALYRPKASSRQISRCIRVFILGLGALATTFALTVSSVKDLWYLCGDVVYCVLFPQLFLALFDPKANKPGAAAGFMVSILLRLGGGVRTLGLPNFLPYPDWMAESSVDFPFRTFAMITGLVTTYVVSRCSYKWSPPCPIEPASTRR